MLPLQSGVGSIANAVLGGLKESDFENLTMYSEILQDSVFDLIRMGKVTAASAAPLPHRHGSGRCTRKIRACIKRPWCSGPWM